MSINTENITYDKSPDLPLNGDISLIISGISGEEKELYYRSRSETSKLLVRKRAVLAFDNKRLVGFILKLALMGKWKELVTLYVVPSHRGRGIARGLVELSIANEKGTIVVFCKNPSSIKIFKDLGFMEIQYSDLPSSVKLIMLFDVVKNVRRIRDFIYGLPEESLVKILAKDME